MCVTLYSLQTIKKVKSIPVRDGSACYKNFKFDFLTYKQWFHMIYSLE